MAANVNQIDPQDLITQLYESKDTNLISSFDIETSFTPKSNIEFFIYDSNKNLLYTEYNYTQYKVFNNGQSAGSNESLSKLEINPESNLIDVGFNQGEFIAYYNFLNKKIGSDLELLYITEISSDRTEIRLSSTVLTDLDIIENTNLFIQERTDSPYFLDFYLNFGDNILLICNNIMLDNQDPNNPTVIIKLYEPLPSELDLNSTLWVVTSIEEPIAYNVSFIEDPIIINDTKKIKGPNFNIDLKDQVNNSTIELSYADLINTSLTSSQNQLNSLLEEKEIDINIDYTDFNNFIHFSSAQTRLENFQYKIGLIESYSSSIGILDNTNSSSLAVSESKAILESKIDQIITNFDGYDYYLYYTSGSYAWPKTNTSPPYQLSPVNSISSLTWFGSTNEFSPYYGGMVLSSSIFDSNNKDNLLYTIPEYLREDPDNESYELFIDMVAQHFDNIWVYYKDVTEKYNTDNRLEYGISKDIVADAIRDFGIKLYQNNFSNVDLYTAFLGLTSDGGLFPFPNITSSLPTPSGYEYINTFISASSDYIPLDDVNKSLYKRIYHNIPYLLKSKGTIPGLRALITSYGIPDTILRINEYGGKDKNNSNDWDYWKNEFNYSYNNEGTNIISASWGLNSDWNSYNDVPGALMLRFKLVTPNPLSGSSPQIIFTDDSQQQELSLIYTGSGLLSGSYSGSIIDPSYQYATLRYIPNLSTPSVSSSIYLPFYNDGWWSVMLNAQPSGSNRNFTLYAANKIYDGGDNGTILGFIESSSISSTGSIWDSSINYQYFGYSYSGSFQEIRYYTNPVSESIFKDFVMNPSSTEGNTINSSPNELVFRASLGNELFTSSISIHPKVTGSWIPTSSFSSNSNFSFNITPTFDENIEYFFYDQPIAGIKNPVSDKIRLENNVLPSGNTLSPFRRLTQQTEASASYTPNINLLEVAFSPQDEINDDINSQIGYFNIGEFIGDPAFRTSSNTSYPNLDVLRNEYFNKYTQKYNLFDYINLIKYFDNSLFKMIKDFVPARTSLASGIVIKQHILERNRYPHQIISWEDSQISGTLKPQWNDYENGTLENFNGGPAGSFIQFNGTSTSPSGSEGLGPNNKLNITQSWFENIETISGSVLILHDTQDEFYNGEFSGSNITVTSQVLSEAYPQSNISLNYKHVYYFAKDLDEQNTFISTFLNTETSPQPGEILFLCTVETTKPKKNEFYNIPTQNFYDVPYIKISKIDCEGNNYSLPLGQFTTLLLYNPTVGGYVQYNVSVANESTDYYLYQTDFYPWNIVEQIGNWFDPKDAQLFDYHFSSSKSSTGSININLGPTFNKIQNWSTENGNLPHYGTPYFSTSSGVYTLENTPNTPFQFSASIITSGSTGGSFLLMLDRQNTISILASSSYASGTNIITTLSSSYYGVQGDEVYLRVFKNNLSPTSKLISSNFYNTQERDNFTLDLFYVAPLSSSCSPVILEPFITTVDFYNSDQNAVINNISENRLSNLFNDVDYSSGALIPTNFISIISGSATKAQIQESNYTTARHIYPRYNGSKSNSQYLNIWTNGDTGTYGKNPTIDSNKVFIGYAETIGGYSPEIMGSSGILLKYIIDQDGNIHVPNVSQNSLYDVQGTFITDEYIYISNPTSNIGDPNLSRRIIRGGQRVEPILYTQSGSMPGGSWVTSLTLTDKNEIGNVISDFQALLKPITTQNIGGNGWNEIKMPFILSSGSATPPFLSDTGTTYRYQITSGMISEGINVVLKGELEITNNNPFTSTAYARIVRWRGGNKTTIGTEVGILGSGYIPGSFPGGPQTFPLNVTATIPFNDLISGDEYTIEVVSGHSQVFYNNSSRFRIEQSPTPNSTFSVANLWISSSAASSSLFNSLGFPGNNIIYSTSSALINYFENNIYQEDIPNSGFFNINVPWSLKSGDEFRFEGREDRVWMVSKAAIINIGTPILAVELNKPIPTSGSVNFDRFLIRRYINDASSIIFEGLKPGNSDGPYIIRPQYLNSELNSKMDAYIEDLTQKGLL